MKFATYQEQMEFARLVADSLLNTQHINVPQDYLRKLVLDCIREITSAPVDEHTPKPPMQENVHRKVKEGIADILSHGIETVKADRLRRQLVDKFRGHGLDMSAASNLTQKLLASAKGFPDTVAKDDPGFVVGKSQASYVVKMYKDDPRRVSSALQSASTLDQVVRILTNG